NLVGQVDELRFERRALIEHVLGEFGMVLNVVIVRMLDDAFSDFEGQIQSAERCVAEFEIFNNAERVQVVIERKTVLAHGGVERLLSRMAEGRMAEIVDQG